MVMWDSVVYCVLAALICLVLLLVYQLAHTLLTDDFSFFEGIPGFFGLCRFGQAVDHAFFDRLGYCKHRVEQTCTSSASDLDDDCSTLSDADPEHGEYKTRWRDPASMFASGDTRERRHSRRSLV
ncbi:hypothetical protein PRIPAC_83128 [Pristionchus pacificus]|uniref:Uncharacterized protein n=1 Tax=Pristionchus pacificus TaxID=54126 RepID=A0A2A6BKJ7_PRIPA|nr:hypothetical protein PRIPAC_83128 [Pristionchus pacificus]|eukprot:PDM66442.1 hypothetical protein PRIPAC_47859 [Pristionchus pacificus]